MKALVIGAAGFVGSYLINHLQADLHWEVYATKMTPETISNLNTPIYDLDILNQHEISNLLSHLCPDCIFHLAAQSSINLSWMNPGLTIDINIKGSVNVLDAIRSLDYKPRVLLIGSGEEYGLVKPEEVPIHEETILRPGNIYAATKACQNMIGSIYTKAYHMNLMMVRAFNHIGPNQAPLFVLADFCKQVAEIEKGFREPIIRVGNLAIKRDFTDVRDVVKAYSAIMQHGEPGETYNVGTGTAMEISEILDIILSLSVEKIKIEIDINKVRPIDIPIFAADTLKLKQLTGWEPKIPFRQTVQDTLDYWKNII